jgi:integrase
LDRRGPYAMRHTYATFSIAAGVDIYVLARRMGTSVEMIERHYAHLVAAGEGTERDVLDRWDARF